jgi:molybdate transport system regulatory protein
MNHLNAVIKSVETEDNISLVIVEAADILFSTLVIDTPATSAYLKEGNEIIMVFKETAMSIAKDLSGGLSIRNRFPATVTDVTCGKVLTSVSLNCKGIMLMAIITTRSANELAIKAGDTVEGLVKTNDISLLQKE